MINKLFKLADKFEDKLSKLAKLDFSHQRDDWAKVDYTRTFINSRLGALLKALKEKKDIEYQIQESLEDTRSLLSLLENLNKKFNNFKPSTDLYNQPPDWNEGTDSSEFLTARQK